MKDKGICLLDRQGKRFNWTPFCDDDFTNNVWVVGQDGPAKHIFMREMLLSTLKSGGRVFVFDYDGRYKSLCSSCNGSLFSFNRDATWCINPFSTLVGDREDRPHEFIGLENLFLSMICVPGESDKFDGLLSLAIEKTWGTYNKQTTMTKIAETLLSMDNLYAHELAEKLNPYTKDGEYAGFFEGQCNLDLNNRVVVFDLSGLTEQSNLQVKIFQTLMHHIENHFFYGDNKTPFQVMINEPWFLLARHNISYLIETFSRRMRWHSGSLVVAVSDMRFGELRSSLQMAFDWAGWKVFFQPKDIQFFKRSADYCMNDDEEALARSIRDGEVYIKGQESYVVGRLQAEGGASEVTA